MSISADEYRRRYQFRNEEQYREGIEAYAESLGYLVQHVEISQGSNKGFPDLVIAGHGHVWWIETKGIRGRIDPAQQLWIDVLQSCGQDARFASSTDPAAIDQIRDELDAAYQHAIERRVGE